MISSLRSYYSPARIRIALLIGLLAGTVFAFAPRSPRAVSYFEVTMRSSVSGTAHLSYDVESVPNATVSVRGGNSEARYQFLLPEGRYSTLRFEPIDQPSAAVILSETRVVDRTGRVIRVIPPSQFKTLNQIERLEVSQTEIRLTAASVGNPPVLAVDLDPPLVLKSFAIASATTYLRRFFTSFLLFSIAGFFVPPAVLAKLNARAHRLSGAAGAWAVAHPSRAILLVAAAAVVLSCYPIVFFGKSFLSPNNHSHTFLLYQEMPTVPGYQEVETDDARGADMGSALWYSWPVSIVEERALFRYFELPLWNRYNSLGLPLLGQGQSMFGDPLHLIVLLANGSAGSWDLKYLAAKLLLAVSLGFCVLRLTNHAPSAALTAATAPFIGFFSYRYSHPAFFTLCYAPFILLCWLNLIGARDRRRAIVWAASMVLANWMIITSGTVKEAYTLFLTVNACGCISLLSTKGVSDKFWKLRQALCVQALFVLISAPAWLTFVRALQVSSTFYDMPEAYQLQPGILVGLFDDIFYRQLNIDEVHLDPSLNFFVLAAILWLCFSPRDRDSTGRLSGLVVISFVSIAIVFGLVPRFLLTGIPFLGRIHHVDNTFSCVAIVCLLVLAGCGIQAFWRDSRTARFRQVYPRFLFSLLLLFSVYLGTTGLVQRSTFLRITEHVPRSPFFWGYSLVLVLAGALLPLAARFALLRGRLLSPQTLSVVLLVILLQWRHGMHLKTRFDAYVMNPQERVNLLAESSEALKLIKARSTEPGRTAGLGRNFSPGYGSAVDVEQIDSADPLLNPYYRTLIDTFGIRLPFASSHDGVIGEDLTSNLSLLDMLNLRFYLGFTKKDYLAPSVKKIAALDLNVYESSSAWPRAFFTNELSPYGSEEEFVSLLKHGDGKPFAGIPASELQTNGELRRSIAGSLPQSTRQIMPGTDYVLTNNTTSFKISATGPGTVVLTEPYVKDDFRLTVNGKPAAYFRVNSAFRGVFIPAAGEYHFSFSYWPRYFTVSLWTSALGAALLGFWALSQWKLSRSGT
ncbi:MAG: hypothetical protein QOH01_2438 [Verrucomicrobiota bacterium]|jgi:hypothetical protein